MMYRSPVTEDAKIKLKKLCVDLSLQNEKELILPAEADQILYELTKANEAYELGYKDGYEDASNLYTSPKRA